jgi:hypothetical protein
VTTLLTQTILIQRQFIYEAAQFRGYNHRIVKFGLWHLTLVAFMVTVAFMATG